MHPGLKVIASLIDKLTLSPHGYCLAFIGGGPTLIIMYPVTSPYVYLQSKLRLSKPSFDIHLTRYHEICGSLSNRRPPHPLLLMLRFFPKLPQLSQFSHNSCKLSVDKVSSRSVSLHLHSAQLL